MIGRIRGRLVAKQPPYLVVDVQGLGYELEAPMSTFYRLPALGAEVVLHTHLLVREDAHLLFGFASEEERRLFRALIRVNGIGARLAVTILSGIEADEFALCIHGGDTARLTRLPGVGKKTAERLLVEMRDRLADWDFARPAAQTAPGGAREDAAADAVSALVALGYKPAEASRLVRGVDCAGLSSETIIREALKATLKA